MSQPIDLRIYLSPPASDARSIFLSLIDAVSAWGLGIEEWQELRIAQGSNENVVHQIKGPLSVSLLKRSVEAYVSTSNTIFSSGLGFQCWRFTSGRPLEGFLRLGIESWDADTQRVVMGRPWLEGAARLLISNVGPYRATLDPKLVKNVHELNHRVEENIEGFMQLVFQVAKHIKPHSMKAFLDAGSFLPFNAHVVFYRDEQSVLADLQQLRHVWEMGIPEYKLPSFEVFDPHAHHWAFSELRLPEAQRELWRQMSSLLRFTDKVTETIVVSTIRSNDFDVYRIDEGIVVLTFPYCFNAFLDPFFVTLLKTASELN
jgi:hypothetical protein